MSAKVLYLPNADAPAFPRKGPGRLPKSIANLSKHRRQRAASQSAPEPELYRQRMRDAIGATAAVVIRERPRWLTDLIAEMKVIADREAASLGTPKGAA
jgi:hypothetical protein